MKHDVIVTSIEARHLPNRKGKRAGLSEDAADRTVSKWLERAIDCYASGQYTALDLGDTHPAFALRIRRD